MTPNVITESPRSLVSMVSSKFREKIESLPNELIDRPEHEILSEIRKHIPEWTPSELDFGIRLNFWREYTYAQQNNYQMRVSDIHKGVCSDRYFFKAMEDKFRLAYILCEFPDEAQKRKLGLSLLWNEMLKIIKMEVPINQRTGAPDSKILSIKTDLFKFLYAYQHGQPVQKIQQETKNLNYNIESQATLPASMEDIDKKIKALEAQTQNVLSPQVQSLLPVEAVAREAGRVTDEEFKR